MHMNSFCRFSGLLRLFFACAFLTGLIHPVSGQDLLNDNIAFSGGTLHLQAFADPGDNKIISMTTRPGDGSLYTVTQSGAVYAIDRLGNSSEWFNYNTAVSSAVSNASNGYVLDSPSNAHGGLRSVAFHPEFQTNGKFYTSAMIDRPSNTSGFNYLGNSSSGFDAESAVVEWTYDHSSGQVLSNSYRELFRVRMPVFDHPIKQMGFNPFSNPGDGDYGLLYITHGDGSVQSATAGGGLNPGDALGKVLWINPLAAAGLPYTTPDNPFVGVSGTLDEIYTLGHRNPHHISFAEDGAGNSFALVAEAGRDNIEEVNLLQAGGNYGWADREGTFVHLASGGYVNGVSPLPANEWELNDYIYPAAQYDHDASPGNGFVGSAVAGGFVINNASDPDLQGQYIFADFGFKSGHVYHADFTEILNAHTQLQDGELPSALTQADIFRLQLTLDSDGDGNVDRVANDLNTLLQLNRNDVRFGMGINGEMYLSSKQTGLVYLVTNSITLLQGDLNADGRVNAEDLSILFANWGDTVPTGLLSGGDGDADGFVGHSDLELVLRNWSEGDAPQINIPEPGSLAFLGLAGFVLSSRRSGRSCAFSSN